MHVSSSKPAQHYGLGLAVGNAEVRLLDLVNAYATLARGGTQRPLRLFGAAPADAGNCGANPPLLALRGVVAAANNFAVPRNPNGPGKPRRPQR